MKLKDEEIIVFVLIGVGLSAASLWGNSSRVSVRLSCRFGSVSNSTVTSGPGSEVTLIRGGNWYGDLSRPAAPSAVRTLGAAPSPYSRCVADIA
jgi:hypothetical protein